VAVEGLRTAISIGDSRVIVLLSWLGVASRIDNKLLSWALRNAGGNKIKVVMHLLLSIDSVSMSQYHPYHTQYGANLLHMISFQIYQEIRSAREEGDSCGNGELLELAEALSRSDTIRTFIQRSPYFTRALYGS
jgi:hypothetical protein